MKISKYKKISKGRYKITFDDGNEIILYEDIIIKNNLLLLNDINLEMLEGLLESNMKFACYDTSLSYIEYKLRTEKELRDYLTRKGFSLSLIDETVNKLKEEKLIDEVKYIEAFINDKVTLTLWGPFKIKRSLINLGLNEEKIDVYLNKIDDSIWKEKLDKTINKKVLSMKNKPLKVIKEKLRLDLFEQGFNSESIALALNTLEKDDKEAMKKEISKAYDKLSKKYEGRELERQIKNHLYKKGFRVDSFDLEDY